MKIGVPKEIKILEYRVGMTPSGVKELASDGHEVFVETNAGMGIGMTDQDYKNAGATILSTAKEVFDIAELIIKVKEPQMQECSMLRSDQVLFTYLHLAADPDQAAALVKSGVTAIAYETVTARDGSLPLLTPMSEVAGRLSIQAGAFSLQKANGGRGVLLGAEVTILDRSITRLRQLNDIFGSRINTQYSTKDAIDSLVVESDLVIGAVLIAGAAAPKLVTKEHVKAMRSGAVMVDISIDQGGCFETSRPTTHAEPTYVIDDVVHYCVTNMPGAVPRTSTFALTNATLPFVKALAGMGWREALKNDKHLANGLNVHNGQINFEAVAQELGYEYLSAEAAISA